MFRVDLWNQSLNLTSFSSYNESARRVSVSNTFPHLTLSPGDSLVSSFTRLVCVSILISSVGFIYSSGFRQLVSDQ